MSEFVCYVHRRRDTGEIFYVGIGSPDRPTDTRSRSRWWKGIAAKAGLDVEVVAEGVSWGQACKWECAAIALLGRRDRGEGALVNLTDGGDGTPGRVDGPAVRARRAEAARARMADPTARRAAADRLRAEWADPDARRLRVEGMRARWADPALRAAHSERGRVQFADPAVRADLANRARAQFADPAARAALVERNRARAKAVRCIETGEVFPCAAAAADALIARGVRADRPNLAAACRGKRKTHAGYRWQFVTNNNETTR